MQTLAKQNHKAVGVERYSKSLNHTQWICAEGRGAPLSFVEFGRRSSYAWNAFPIERTDIIPSTPAISRELKFPLDIHQSDLPSPISDTKNSVVEYIRYLGQDVCYARELLKSLLSDRREAHRKRECKVGDIVMRCALESDKYW